MIDVGFKFKPPKKNNIKKWNELKKTWTSQKIYETKTNEYIYIGQKACLFNYSNKFNL